MLLSYVNVRFQILTLMFMLMPLVETRLRLKYASVSDNGYNYTLTDAKCFVMSGSLNAIFEIFKTCLKIGFLSIIQGVCSTSTTIICYMIFLL